MIIIDRPRLAIHSPQRAMETLMSNPTTKPDAPEADAALTDEQLRGVSGGNSIDKIPNIRTPKFGPSASISQGEVNSNQTDDNLP
jgi:hypothetical protein